MSHNFDSIEWEEREAARVDLLKPHGELNSILALRERLEKVETLLGVKPVEEKA